MNVMKVLVFMEVAQTRLDRTFANVTVDFNLTLEGTDVSMSTNVCQNHSIDVNRNVSI